MTARILVVDDEPAVADLINVILASEGYIVAVARDGIDGLTMARDWAPDLIFMDLMLPGLDGSVAIQRLKSDPATSGIPIVAMSAGRVIRNHTDALHRADAALSKPFDIDALLAQVEFLLARRRSEPTIDNLPRP